MDLSGTQAPSLAVFRRGTIFLPLRASKFGTRYHVACLIHRKRSRSNKFLLRETAKTLLWLQQLNLTDGHPQLPLSVQFSRRTMLRYTVYSHIPNRHPPLISSMLMFRSCVSCRGDSVCAFAPRLPLLYVIFETQIDARHRFIRERAKMERATSSTVHIWVVSISVLYSTYTHRSILQLWVLDQETAEF